MSREKEILITFEKERLADLIIYLMEGLQKEEKIRFISKYIDPKLALESIDKGTVSDFLKEVKEFCADCLNGDYYAEPEYDDYWDSYDEGTFEHCEWAENFTSYFNVTIMYSRSGDYYRGGRKNKVCESSLLLQCNKRYINYLKKAAGILYIL